MSVKVLIMSGYGINCETESAHAFEEAGATCEIVHVNDLISEKKRMNDFDIMMFPGGFSYGDDTGSGNAFANKLKNNLWEDVIEFIRAEKLILGICNGFQIMTHLGLFALQGTQYGERTHSLEFNTNHRYECRWVKLKTQSSNCVFIKGMDKTHIPIAHGEGRFFCEDSVYEQFRDGGQIVFTYCNEDGQLAGGVYPGNPNGSLNDVAAICDRSGRIMGMMPHPERGLYSTSEPEYHLKKELALRNGDEIPEMVETNFKLFQNAVDYTKVWKAKR